MLRFQQAEFSYEPYPICLIPSAIADADYQEMLKTYPDLSLFEFKPKLGNKYSLSERNNRREYASFISKSPLWARFHSYIKSRKFIDETLALLKANNIDLDLDEYMFRGARGKPKRSLMSKLLDRTELNARFEFSIMSSTGGHIRPHTDEPKKLITLVVSILEASEWSSEWGGGTQVCFPRTGPDHSIKRTSILISRRWKRFGTMLSGPISAFFSSRPITLGIMFSQ
jgi:hypothetical protein